MTPPVAELKMVDLEKPIINPPAESVPTVYSCGSVAMIDYHDGRVEIIRG